MKPTTGTLRKIMGGTVTTEKLDQMRKRLKVAARKASDAKNEYLLGLEAVNKHQHYYHQIVLPQLMRVRQRQARACTRTRLAGRLTLQTPHARMCVGGRGGDPRRKVGPTLTPGMVRPTLTLIAAGMHGGGRDGGEPDQPRP